MIRYRLSPQLLWALLAGQLIVLLPYVTLLPAWIYFIFGISAFWRLMVAYGYWSLPKIVTVYSIAIFAGLLIFLQIGLTREAALSLLALAFCLKLLELKALRDSMIILFLGYFLLSIYFLYSHSFITTFYAFAAFLLLTIVLIGLNRIGDVLPVGGVLKKALVLILQAVPLAAISFIFFPRFSIPLWNAPEGNDTGISGFSRVVEPGSISQLAQSNKVAFRAQFSKKEPLQKDLYWRGLVLSDFDGRRWSATGAVGNNPMPDFTSSKNSSLSYDVFLEPTHQLWLFAIDKVQYATGEVVMAPDFRLEAKAPVQKTFRYQAHSILNASDKTKLSPEDLKILVKLPENNNPASKTLARKLFTEANANSNQYISLVLDYFRKNAFIYTLNPPRSSENAIDDFLLNSKRGFCEHYAAAFTFLMRAAHVPARVVVGYQGGEFNPYSHYWVVRQYHAHAWSEVWLQETGWLRIDPTESVDPSRIELGVGDDIKDKIANSSHFFLMKWLEKKAGKSILNGFLWGADAVETFWQHAISDYRAPQQKSLLQWLTHSHFSWTPFVLVLSILTGLVVVLLSFALLSTRRPLLLRDPVLKAYLLFCRKLAKMGIVRKKEEGPYDFMHRVVRVRPDLKQAAEEINELYVGLQYRDLSRNKGAIKELHNKIRRLKA